MPRDLAPWEQLMINRTVRTPMWLWSFLGREAVRRGKTSSGLAREVLEEWAIAHDDGEPTRAS